MKKPTGVAWTYVKGTSTVFSLDEWAATDTVRYMTRRVGIVRSIGGIVWEAEVYSDPYKDDEPKVTRAEVANLEEGKRWVEMVYRLEQT